jgi:hypothetical protein
MHGATRIVGEERFGNLQRADALAFRFDVDGTRRIESLQRFDELALERLLRGLRIDGRSPSSDPR